MDIPEIMKGRATQETVSGREARGKLLDFLLYDIINQLEDAERDIEGSLTRNGRLQCKLILVNFLIKAKALAPSAESVSD